MRQWLVDPKILCDKHLRGEHLEHHMFVGTLRKGISVKGYIENNLLEPLSLIKRHEELSQEMLRRGFRHQSNLQINEEELKRLVKPEHLYSKINIHESMKELLRRCDDCRKRYNEILKVDSMMTKNEGEENVYD